MDHLLENRVLFALAGMAAALVMFVPSIVGHVRRPRSMRTIAALNAFA